MLEKGCYIQLTHHRLALVGEPPNVVGMSPELTDEQTEALVRLLSRTIDDDRYPLSPRMRVLKDILAKFRPEPVRPPLPPRRHYEPPRAGRYRRRR
jgi:hypothetical protein